MSVLHKDLLCIKVFDDRIPNLLLFLVAATQLSAWIFGLGVRTWLFARILKIGGRLVPWGYMQRPDLFGYGCF